MTQVVAIAVGLGAVVAASAHAYTVLKVIGAGYVVWLGVQAIRHRGDARVALEGIDPVPVRPARALRSLRIGFTVGVTNPKTIVFFVAFLPQFVNDAAGHTGLQLAVLGLVFGVMCVASDSIWALAAARARDWFASRPQRLDTLSVTGGVMMIGLGATMAAAE